MPIESQFAAGRPFEGKGMYCSTGGLLQAAVHWSCFKVGLVLPQERRVVDYCMSARESRLEVSCMCDGASFHSPLSIN